MEFGKVADSLVDQIDFSLPADGKYTSLTLPGKKAEDVNIYVGCAKWGRKEWVGNLYPKGTKESEFLDYYVKNFNGIELNATHYKIYPDTSIKKWADKAANENFRFCPKVPQTISHYSDLSSAKAQDLTSAFLEGVIAFGDKLGPIFLQLSEKYTPQRREQLFSYLEKLPVDVRFCLEVRHPSWFENEFRDELFGKLAALNIGTVITDTSGRRDCLHMELTAPYAFIRFVGNGLHPTDYERIDEWVQRIKNWISQGIGEVYFFMHQHDEMDSVALCDYVIKRLNEVCKLEIRRPGLPDIQASLFD